MTEKQEETKIELPPIPKKLLDALNKLFPERSADLAWSDKEVWFRSGQRTVIRFLNSHFNNQNLMEKK